MTINVTHINKSGQSTDLTQLVQSITWSGDIMGASRQIEFSIVSSPTDYFLPRPDVSCGDLIILRAQQKELFRGFVFTRDKSYQGDSISFTVYDPAIRLLKIQAAYNFKNTTAEAITRQICSDYGIPAGDIAVTSILQNKICIGESLYDIIIKAYTHAAKINGKKYMILFMENRLNVVEKGYLLTEFVLQNETNLTDSTYSESIEDMVNKVIIVDDNGNKVGEVQNAEWEKNYGLFQQVYKKEKDKNAVTMAQAMLKGMTQEASITALGDVRCIAGASVMIKDPYTGLVGKFYIDADSHIFENDTHVMDLTLNFDNIMDEKEYQEVVAKASSDKAKSSTFKWSDYSGEGENKTEKFDWSDWEDMGDDDYDE